MSRNTRCPTIGYVRSAKYQISLHIRAFWSEPLLFLEYSLIVKLLTERNLEFLSLKGGWKGSYESTVVKSHIVGNHMSRLKWFDEPMPLIWAVCLMVLEIVFEFMMLRAWQIWTPKGMVSRVNLSTVKPALSGHPKRSPKIGFQYQLSLNAGQKYCRMLQETYIKLPFVFKTFVMSIFEWSLKADFTVFKSFNINRLLTY